MLRRPPRSTRTDTLFPYTTLFRSDWIETKAIYRALSGLGVSHEMQEVLCSCQAARGGIAFKASIVIIGRRRAVHPVTLSNISYAGKGQRLHETSRNIEAASTEKRRVGKTCVGTCISRCWPCDS